MSIDEPTALGTVVGTERGHLCVLARPAGYPRWWDIDSHVWLEWLEIAPSNPVVIHEGYTPPTPEPTGVLAVIRDAKGVLRVRHEGQDVCWWERADATGALPWKAIHQPVEVLFEGVDE